MNLLVVMSSRELLFRHDAELLIRQGLQSVPVPDWLLDRHEVVLEVFNLVLRRSVLNLSSMDFSWHDRVSSLLGVDFEDVAQSLEPSCKAAERALFGCV